MSSNSYSQILYFNAILFIVVKSSLGLCGGYLDDEVRGSDFVNGRGWIVLVLALFGLFNVLSLHTPFLSIDANLSFMHRFSFYSSDSCICNCLISWLYFCLISSLSALIFSTFLPNTNNTSLNSQFWQHPISAIMWSIFYSIFPTKLITRAPLSWYRFVDSPAFCFGGFVGLYRVLCI
jgi:hypothetical protein